MTALILAALFLVQPPAAVNVTASEPSGTSSMPGYSVEAGAGGRVPSPGHVADAASVRDLGPSGLNDRVTASVLIGGTATWFCGGGSPCTRGHSPSELIAAIDPTLGIPKGARVRVTSGGRNVTVTVVDVCACKGRRIIDLSRLAFSRLADPSRGVIPVEVTYGEGPQVTLPPTDMEAP